MKNNTVGLYLLNNISLFSSGFVRRRYSLILSILLAISIAFIVALACVNALGRMYSFRLFGVIFLVALGILFLPVWYMVCKFVDRLKVKLVAAHWPIYILLAGFLVFAGQYARSHYKPSAFRLPDVQYEVEVAHESNPSGEICLLEIKDKNGKSIRRNSELVSNITLSGDWTSKKGDCLYFSQGERSGSLKYNYVSQIDEVITFIFRRNENGGNVLIHINGRQIAASNLYWSSQDNLPISIQVGRSTMLAWNSFATAGWSAIILTLLMLAVIVPKDSQFQSWSTRGYALVSGFNTALQRNVSRSPQVRTVLDFLEKRRWLLLVIVAMMFFLPAEIVPSGGDAAYYLSLAKNLYHGDGYVNPDLSPAILRGPVFPLLISASYFVFGETFRSALILERIFWVLTVIISYVLGKQLYDRRVGFYAGFLVLFAAVINGIFNRIWTDGPATFMILLVQLVYWDVYRKQRDVKWYILMGALMGTTYLLRQTVLFIVPMPFLLWMIFPEYRTRQNFGKLLICYLTFACFFFGWMGYVYWAGGSAGQITKDLNSGFSYLSYIRRSIISFITGQSVTSSAAHGQGILLSPLSMLRLYYQRDIAGYFSLAFIFPITLVYMAYQAVWKKTRPDIFLGIGLLLFTILIPIQIVANFGPRHNIYLYVIVLIGSAAMLSRFLRGLPEMVSNVALAIIVSVIIWVQVQNHPPNTDYFPPLKVFTPALFEQPLNFYAQDAETAAWVDQHIHPDERIMLSERHGNRLHILTTGNRHFEVFNTCVGELSRRPAERCMPPYISFWVYRGTTDPNEPRDRLQGFSEPWLISAIREKDVKYLIVKWEVDALYSYLKANPSFKEVVMLGDTVIFNVVPPVSPLSAIGMKWETCIGKGTPEYLRNLRQSNSASYEAKLHQILEPWMGLSREDLIRFEDWQGCQFDTVPSE